MRESSQLESSRNRYLVDHCPGAFLTLTTFPLTYLPAGYLMAPALILTTCFYIPGAARAADYPWLSVRRFCLCISFMSFSNSSFFSLSIELIFGSVNYSRFLFSYSNFLLSSSSFFSNTYSMSSFQIVIRSPLLLWAPSGSSILPNTSLPAGIKIASTGLIFADKVLVGSSKVWHNSIDL